MMYLVVVGCTVCRLLGTAQVVQIEICLQTNQRRDSLKSHIEELLMRDFHRDLWCVFT